MCCILSQLNILCSSLVKLHYTKITILSLLTFHTLPPMYMFSVSNVLDFIETL